MRISRTFPSQALVCLIVAATLMWSSSSCAIIRTFSSDAAEPFLSADSLSRLTNAAGTIEAVTYKCSVQGPSHRRMMVYLPEGYYSDSRRYPVVYMFHGARGNETSWFTKGNAVQIVDSLVQTGLIDPCIYVFANMNQYTDDKDAYHSRFKLPFESFFDTNGAVETGFVDDVVKLVDRRYRTLADKKHRAIVGLSVGALQSVFISANHPDMFGKVGLFSPMYKAYITKSPYSGFYKGLKEKQKVQFADAPDLYGIYIGRDDFFFSHMEYFRQYLSFRKYPFEYIGTKGGHDWPNWRMYIDMFLREAFPAAH